MNRVELLNLFSNTLHYSITGDNRKVNQRQKVKRVAKKEPNSGPEPENRRQVAVNGIQRKDSADGRDVKLSFYAVHLWLL